jgi:DNA-binding transcriptional LysR family regulator
MHARIEMRPHCTYVMRLRINELDWNLARAFTATVDAGSLTGAARALGLNQSTVSRQIAALEASLGLTLFDRVGKRLLLTDAGRALVPHTAAMRDAADALRLAATGRSQDLAGPVTISASDAVALYLLPPIIAQVRARLPNVTVRVLVANTLSDLRRREADIAIRHVRPTEPELVGRLIGHGTARFYASRSWIAQHGHPRCAADVTGASLIGPDDDGRFTSYLGAMGVRVAADELRVISENSVVAWELARRGLGIAAILVEIAERMPELVAVLDDLPPIRFPFWLVTHSEVRTAPRIRLVFDLLAEGLAARG